MNTSWSDPDFDLVVRVVSNHAGLDFMPERRASVEVGIRRSMARARIEKLSEYSRRIASDGGLLRDLRDGLTVGETYVVREPSHFQFMREVLIPELRRPANLEKKFRIWSAACSSGEEPYSLAMLFEEEQMADRLFLMATDLSSAALEKAKRATYGDWSFRGESGQLARRHMGRSDKNYVVLESIRRRVNFSHLNLASTSYPSLVGGPWEMDLIFCRNVLIYFDRKTVREVANRMYDSLAPGGWLITASCDPTLSELAPFEAVVTSYGVFYHRRATPAMILPSFGGVQTSAINIALATRPFSPTPVPTANAEHRRPSPASELVNAAGGNVAKSKAEQDRERLLVKARDELDRGNYERVISLVDPHRDDAGACALHVRALANIDVKRAEQVCAESQAKHPLSSELSYLRSVLLADLGRIEDACAAAKKTLYLDRTLAIVHFFMGGLLKRRGDREGARRAYRNAHELCSGRPSQEEVPLSDGELAGALAEAARLQMERLALSPEPEVP